MKYTYKPSPNYRQKQSTISIMRDLTVCLLSIVLFATVYNSLRYGFATGMRVILMTAAAVVTALVTEAAYFKVTGAKDIVTEVRHSFGWVTAIIMVLITRLDVSIYAIVISTVICIIFGKLVFGGFGQNIFNPAAFGEAIIMNSFAASKAANITADVYSGATPMTAMNSYGWVMENSVFEEFIQQFGGLGNMLIGNYPTVIGASCAILVIICGAYMMWKKDIDWHLTVTYILSVFVISLVVGMIHGEGLWFAIFNLITGGVLFCGIFMMTDPVTTPITIPGRMIFAFGAAALTLIIRWKANLPDGALYSVLLMNMLTPAIDKMIKGNQIKEAKQIRNEVIIAGVVCTLIAILVGAFLEGKTPVVASSSAPASALSAEDFSSTNVSCTDQGNGVYACSAKGFEGVNEATVTIENGAVKAIEVTAFNDTPGVGDMAVAEGELSRYVGATTSSAIDSTSGASFTSTSLRAMVYEALTMAGE